jgi:hypothetical protein
MLFSSWFGAIIHRMFFFSWFEVVTHYILFFFFILSPLFCSLHLSTPLLSSWSFDLAHHVLLLVRFFQVEPHVLMQKICAT